MNLRCCL